MIERADKVKQKLRDAKDRYIKQGHLVSVVVGYKKAYALPVHENEEEKWRGKPRKPNPPHKGSYWDPPGRGQSKYLEKPFREGRDTIADIVMNRLRAGYSMAKALLDAGRWLQAESMDIVPVEFGDLKGSAYAEIEK